MKIVVEQRGIEHMAQVVHIGDGLHWMEHQRIQYKMAKWVKENCQGRYYISGWQFYFFDKRDIEWFLLKWNH